MRRYLAYIIVLILAVCIGLVVAHDPGYALFSYHHYIIEMPLWLAALFAIIIFGVLVAILRLFDNTRYLLQRARYWKEKQTLLKLQKQSDQGMLELLEGRFKLAEKHLKASATQQDTPLMNYLSAAQAANALGAYHRRDAYLSKAKDKQPKAETAVLIIKAQLQIDQNQLHPAEHTLQRLYKKHPKHETVLRLLKDLYLKQANWQALMDLLPRLKKLNLLNNTELEHLIIQAQCELLQQADAPKKAWQRLSKHARQTPEILDTYLKTLLSQQEDEAAKFLIEDQLKRHWSNTLCDIYGKLRLEDPNKALKTAEKWLKKRPDNPTLLFTLGKLAQRCQLPNLAKTYYQNSLTLNPNPKIHQALAHLLETQGNANEALKHYRCALDDTDH